MRMQINLDIMVFSPTYPANVELHAVREEINFYEGINGKKPMLV